MPFENTYPQERQSVKSARRNTSSHSAGNRELFEVCKKKSEIYIIMICFACVCVCVCVDVSEVGVVPHAKKQTNKKKNG